MKLNLADTDSFTGFDAIDRGTYHCKITDGEMTEVKNDGKLKAGTPGINWTFTVQDGDFAGRKVFTNTWIAPTTMGFVKGLLEASGRFTKEQLDGELDFEIDDVLGADVMCRVTKREYPADSGEYVNDVKSIKAWSEGMTSVSAASESSSSGGALLP
jgi:hypothetical protein